MRILTISDGSGPGSTGGSNVAASELANQLRVLGHDTTMLAGVKQVARGAPSNYLLYNSQGNTLKRVMSSKSVVSQYLGKSCCDIVHTHFALYDFSLDKTSRHGLPFLRTFHGPWDLESEYEEAGISTEPARKSLKSKLKMAIRFKVEKRSLELATHVTVLSESFKSIVCNRYGISPHKVSLIPGGVDLSRFNPSLDREADRKNLGLDHDKTYILSIRRLVPRMGLDLLVEAMPEVIREIPNAVLLIGGKGPFREYLEQRVAALKLETAVRFLGFITEDDLPIYYRSVNLFAMPSRALEGFGLVTLEALASGTPVVATPVGGNVEILSALDSSLIADAIDSTSLAKCILLALRKHRITSALSTSLNKWVTSHYSWEKYARETEALYQSVIAGNKNQ